MPGAWIGLTGISSIASKTSWIQRRLPGHRRAGVMPSAHLGLEGLVVRGIVVVVLRDETFSRRSKFVRLQTLDRQRWTLLAR